MTEDKFVDGSLHLEWHEDAANVTVLWTGRSVAREPGLFILPIMTRAMECAQRHEKRVVLDFRQLEYLNSSTITPVIRTLEQAKRGSNQVTVLYTSALKWQALAFSALYLFGTADGRIQIQGQ